MNNIDGEKTTRIALDCFKNDYYNIFVNYNSDWLKKVEQVRKNYVCSVKTYLFK